MNLNKKNYEIKDVSVTPYYTFEQLFHDFAFFLKSEDITLHNSREKESWILEINCEPFTAENLLGESIKNIISDDDHCVFHQRKIESELDFETQKKIFTLVRNRTVPFNIVLVDSLKSTLFRIRANDENIGEMLRTVVSNLHRPRNTESPVPYFFATRGGVPLHIGMTIMTDSFLDFMQTTTQEMRQTDVVVALKETYFDSLPEESCTVGEVCIICQDEFEEEFPIKKIRCGHEFHIDCVKPWLTKESIYCPMCRIELCDNDSQKEYHNT